MVAPGWVSRGAGGGGELHRAASPVPGESDGLGSFVGTGYRTTLPRVLKKTRLAFFRKTRLELFQEDFGTALVVVQELLLLRKGRHCRLGKSALDKPVRCPRGQNEQAIHVQPPRLYVDVTQKAISSAGIAILRMDGEACPFAGCLISEWV